MNMLEYFKENFIFIYYCLIIVNIFIFLMLYVIILYYPLIQLKSKTNMRFIDNEYKFKYIHSDIDIIEDSINELEDKINKLEDTVNKKLN